MLAITGAYPLKGQQAITLLRVVAKRAIWDQYFAKGYINDHTNHDLTFF